MWALKPTSNRGSYAPRGDGRHGMAIVNDQRFAEALTYGRPEKRPALLRLVVETMRGQERVFAISGARVLTQSERT